MSEYCEPTDDEKMVLSETGHMMGDEIVRLQSQLAEANKRIEEAYDKGFREGETKQAILENQGKDRFLYSITTAANKLFGPGAGPKLRRGIYEADTAALKGTPK